MHQFLERVLLYWEEGGRKVGGALISHMTSIRLHMEVWNLHTAKEGGGSMDHHMAAANCTIYSLQNGIPIFPAILEACRTCSCLHAVVENNTTLLQYLAHLCASGNFSSWSRDKLAVSLTHGHPANGGRRLAGKQDGHNVSQVSGLDD